MGEEKISVIEKSISDFVKLPQEKKMFVLGFMQGVLVNKDEKDKQNDVKGNLWYLMLDKKLQIKIGKGDFVMTEQEIIKKVSEDVLNTSRDIVPRTAKREKLIYLTGFILYAYVYGLISQKAYNTLDKRIDGALKGLSE